MADDQKKQPSVWERVKATAKQYLSDDKKPAPSQLGSGYAQNAASAAQKRNQETEKAAKELDQYKKGGKVKKTGPAKVHKGERVLTTAQTKKFEKSPMIKKKILGKKKKEPTVADYRKKR